jgi:hypothetical protein
VTAVAKSAAKMASTDFGSEGIFGVKAAVFMLGKSK